MALNRKQQELLLLGYRLNLQYAFLKYYVINGYQYHAYRLRALLNTHHQFLKVLQLVDRLLCLPLHLLLINYR